jgi:hypothetical protein
VPVNRTVVLSETAYRQIQTYAIVTGVSMERAASDAISEWMHTTGNLFVEASQRMRRASATKPKLKIVSSAGSIMNTESDLK